MTELTIHEVGPGFGTIIEGFEPAMLGNTEIIKTLQDQFDARGVVVLRDVDITYAEQVALCAMLRSPSRHLAPWSARYDSGPTLPSMVRPRRC